MKKRVSATFFKTQRYFWGNICANVCKSYTGFGTILFYKYSTIQYEPCNWTNCIYGLLGQYCSALCTFQGNIHWSEKH